MYIIASECWQSGMVLSLRERIARDILYRMVFVRWLSVSLFSRSVANDTTAVFTEAGGDTFRTACQYDERRRLIFLRTP